MWSNAATVFAAHVAAWHVGAAVFAVLDWGKWLWRYKVVKKDTVSYLSCMPVVLFNQFCILLPIMVAAERLGLAFSSARIPLLLFPVHAFLLGAIHDAVFYAGHRLLHTRLLFPLHRLHHRSTGAVAASSLYMSPLDFVAEIVLPYGAFLCLIQSDVRFDVLLASAGSLLAMYEHSGYCFTFFKPLDSRMHMSHHVGRLNGSFSEGVGSPGYMDELFGTKLQDNNARLHLAQQ